MAGDLKNQHLLLRQQVTKKHIIDGPPCPGLHLGLQNNVKVVFHSRGGERSETSLHIACQMAGTRGEKCAKMLLKSGADPNFPMGQGGDTPLHVAAAAQATGAVRILKLLLENGANIEKLNHDGESALHTSVKTCNFKAVKV